MGYSFEIRLILRSFIAAILFSVLIVNWKFDPLPPESLIFKEKEIPRQPPFWRGLQQFAQAAENQMAHKPIPDVKKWRSQRIRTIDKLKELRTKLDNVCFYSSCGKVAGSSMGILCFLSYVASAVVGVPLSPLVASFGGILGPTGYLTREASSILESILSAKYQNEFQDVWLKDKEVSKSLNEWLHFSSHLEKEFQDIFGFDIKSKRSIEVTLLNEFYKLLTRLKNFEEALKQMKSSKYASLLDESFETDELREFSERILDSLSFSKQIQYSLYIFNNLFDANSTRSLMNIYEIVRKGKLTSTILFLREKLDIKIPFPVKMSAFILLNIFDLVKEVTYTIDEAKIIRDGKCPYSDSLKHITDMLEHELSIIESSFSIGCYGINCRLAKNRFTQHRRILDSEGH